MFRFKVIALCLRQFDNSKGSSWSRKRSHKDFGIVGKHHHINKQKEEDQGDLPAAHLIDLARDAAVKNKTFSTPRYVRSDQFF